MSNRDGFFIDFTGYKESSSSRLTANEDGKYLVRVVDAELVETKKGDPMVNLYYNVIGGVHDGEHLIDRLVLTDKARWKIKKVLTALGIKVNLANMNVPFKLLNGRTLVVRVEDGEPYNGETRSEIREYFPAATWSSVSPPVTEASPEVDTSTIAEVAEAEDNSVPFDTDSEISVPDSGEVTL